MRQEAWSLEELLLWIRELQSLNKAIFGKSYWTDYEEYIYLDKLGQQVKSDYITQNFTRTLKKMATTNQISRPQS